MSKFTITEIAVNEKYNKFIPWLICSIGAAFYCYEYLLRIAPSVMTTELMQTYHLTAGQLGDLTAFYYYAYTPLQLIIGMLMDRYGPRHLLMLACSACAIGAFIFAGNHNIYLAELSRFLVGFGSAFAFVGALKLATIWLPPERFAVISGMITTLGMVGAMAGDITLTKFVNVYGWRSTTFMSAWLGVILVIFIFLFVHDKVKVKTRKQSIYTPELTFKQVFIGLAKCAKNPYLWIVGIMGSFLYLPISAFAELWGIPYLTQAHHLPSTSAASTISMIFLGWAIGAPLAGWVSDITQQRKLPIMIGSILAIIAICIVLYVPNLSSVSLHIWLFIFGVLTSVEIIVFAIGREVSPNRFAGTAIALTNAFIMLGGALFQPIIGILLDWRWNGKIWHGIHFYSTQNYQFALSVLPIGLFIVFLLSFLLRETHCHVLNS